MRPVVRAVIATATLAVALAAPTLGQSPSPAPSAAPAASTVPVASGVPMAPSLTWTRLDELPGKPKALVTTGAFGADGSLVLMGGMNPYEGAPVAWSSADGTSWTLVKPGGPKKAHPQFVLPIATGGYVAIGTQETMWTSPDGLKWKAANEPLKEIHPFNATVGPDGSLVLVGPDRETFEVPVVARTTDMAQRDATVLPVVAGGARELSEVVVHPDGRTLVAAGARGTDGTAFWVTSDGSAWTGVLAPDADPDAYLTGLAATPSGFVAVLNHLTDAGPDGVVYASEDGLAWDEVLRVPGTILRSPIALPGGAVAVPQAGILNTSLDGRTWTATPEAAFDGPFFLLGSTTAPDGRVLAWGWKKDNAGSVIWLGTPAS
jgi:hypothetical protein